MEELPFAHMRNCIKNACFLLFAFCCFTTQAAENFSFIEYNAAFVLGLSLPLIIIAFVIRERIINSWWYLVLLGASLLTIFYQLTVSPEQLNKAVYSACAIFILLISIQPRTGSLSKDNKIEQVLWCNYFTLLITILFLTHTWFIELVSDHYMWAALSGTLVVTSFIRLSSINKVHQQDTFRYHFLWLLTIIFSTLVFMQPHWQLSIYSIVVTGVACYLVSFINYTWLLTSKVTKRVKKELEDKYAPQIDELKNLSRDAITNLPSQAQALKCFEQQLANKESYQYAVIVFKPINFAKVNHLLGHHNSDLLLLQLAYCLQKQVEKNLELINFDTENHPVRIARLSSLQFIIILDLSTAEHAPEEYVKELCRNLSEAVPDAISFKSFSLNFELAFGTDYFNQKSADINQCIAWACDALMDAENSRQGLSFFNHQKNHYSEDKLLKMEQLKQDLHAENLVWQCQPQINIHTKQIAGIELSVYWPQTNNELHRLNDFYELAENSGELYHLIKTMIIKACQIVASNKQQGIEIPITIDFSCLDLFEDTLVEFIDAQISKHHISAELIIIEIPEAVISSASDRAKSLIFQLRSIGVGIAIDDFSGSYESLRYLRKLTVKQLKVDCGLLMINEERQTEKAIINALINLGRVMHIPIVGFNINNAATLQILNEIGGTLAQGNIISPNIDESQLTPWIQHWQQTNP